MRPRRERRITSCSTGSHVKAGADTAKFSVVNTATPGLVGYALADRATAVQLWEPAYTTLHSKKPTIKTIDLGIAESWKKFTGSRNIPYLGVAAHVAWAEKNPELVKKLFAAYKEAAEWVATHPDDAAKLIAAKGTPDDQKAIGEAHSGKRPAWDERQVGLRR